jgi:hypothetical protein
MVVDCNPIFGPAPHDVREKLAFVLMPLKNARLNEIYKDIVKPTIESKGLDCFRANDYETNEVVMKDVWLGICQARVVIAEMSGLNANVMYELGMSHTFGTPTVMVGQPTENGKLPFDISHIRAIIYNDDAAGREYLLDRLSKTLDFVLSLGVEKPKDTAESLQAQTQGSLENHRNTLLNTFVQAYDEARGQLIPVCIFFDGFYSTFFRRFAFSAALLEHFQTGHPDIYSPLNSVLDSEKKMRELAEILFPKIQARLRNQFREIRFHAIVQQDQPTFEDQHVIEFIIQKFDLNSTFRASMDNSSRIIISENETFRLYNSDQTLADRLAAYLTDLVQIFH